MFSYNKERTRLKTVKIKQTAGILEDRLRRKADRLLQEVYTKGNCEVCGEPAQCVHHVIYKSQSNFLRYNPKNLVPICNKCHSLLHKTGDSRILGTIIAKRGIEWHEELQIIRHELCCLSEQYLKEIIDNLNTQIKIWK